MKIYKVVPLGKNDEKGEQLENQEFRKKCIIFGGEKGEQLKQGQDEKY